MVLREDWPTLSERLFSQSARKDIRWLDSFDAVDSVLAL
jgi:hypothetical protein